MINFLCTRCHVDPGTGFCSTADALKDNSVSLFHPCLAPLSLAFAVVTISASAAPGPFALLHSLFDPSTNAQSGAEQGYSVAVDGNFAVVGALRDETYGDDAGLVKVYDATTGKVLHTLANPDPFGQQYFGWAVAVSGTRVVVGGSLGDAGTNRVETVYVYDLAGATPTLPTFRLNNPSGRGYQYFGTAVAASGTRIVVGAYRDDGITVSTNGGNAYLYDLASATPTVPVVTLTNPTPITSAWFGKTVALSGTRVVIGAPGADTGVPGVANVFVYDIAGVAPTVPVVSLVDPKPGETGNFGTSVAIDGTRLVVGSVHQAAGVPGAHIVYMYDLAGVTPHVPWLTLTNPSPQTAELFGYATAISGTRVVVGAYRNASVSFDTSIAYVFDLTAAVPAVPVLTLTNPAARSGDYFGFSVALSGTRAIVGAPLADFPAHDAGSAYVYDFAGATPSAPSCTLNDPSPASADAFGAAVGLSGQRLVIGAYSAGVGDVGIAYVYDLAATAATAPAMTLTNPNPALGDSFGDAVAIAGTRVAIGAPYDDAGAFNAGSAYVFDLAGVTPTAPIVMLTNPSPAFDERFGSAVAISGSRVVIGSVTDNVGGIAAGSAYVYDVAGATPRVPVFTLNNPSPAHGDGFGHSVAISGAFVVIGADFDDKGARDAGSVYVYDLTSPTPTVPALTLSNPSPEIGDNFGSSVALSGFRLVVGADLDHAGTTRAGAAYVYDLSSSTPSSPTLTLTNPNPSDYSYFGYSVAISGTRVVVGAVWDDSSAPDGGIAYVYDLTGATPEVPEATLTNPSPVLYDGFGFAVAIDGTTVVAGTPEDDTGAANRGAAYVFGLQPALSLLPSAPGLATLSWSPTNSPGFVLQYTDSLAPTNWMNAPSGAINPVTISATNAARFYRLFQQ